MLDRRPAEAFHPGEFLGEELEERGWTQTEFAEIIGRPVRLVNEIVKGKRGVTPGTAKELGAALGTSAEFWMNLETKYQLWKSGPAAPSIIRRANMRTRYPIRDMINRHWIQSSDDVQIMENRILRYFEIDSMEDVPALAYAAKRSGILGELSPIQLAWLYRVKHIAKSISVPQYSKERLVTTVTKLAGLRSSAEDIKYIPELLAESGVRFIVVEPLPSSKIDGVCLWLDNSPVIGLSLRFDRIDNFWFVLRHEIEHILMGHGKTKPIIAVDLFSKVADVEKLVPEERAANAVAAEFCVPQQLFEEFMVQVEPYVSREKVMRFSLEQGIHPGLVVGQIQRRLNRYDLLRSFLVSIRKIITTEAVTDGYGYIFSGI